MRLLERQNDGSLQFTENVPDADITQYPYAILSHRWGRTCDEVTYEDIQRGDGRNKPGFEKIAFCSEQAKHDGLRYIWVDSCCIKKSDSTELGRAINSMYRWYAGAARCYVYLSDVSVDGRSLEDRSKWIQSFRQSVWFQRGWTLQELLAPSSVEFFSRERMPLGNKRSMSRMISELTGIAVQALEGASLSQFSVDDRLEWARLRCTSEPEDWAYSLWGIFNVMMTPRYGEGRDNAIERLKRRIDKASNKRSHDTATEPIDATVKRAKTHIEASSEADPLPSISKAELLAALHFDQINDRFTNIRSQHAQTCRWLLRTPEYRQWLSRDKSRGQGALWIEGKAGSGKSTLMKFILKETKRHTGGTPILSFFFNARGSALERSTTGLYRSLLVQLLDTIDEGQALKLLDDSNIRQINQLKEDHRLLQDLILQTVPLLSFGAQQKLIIIIDALDECPEKEIRQMVAFF